eukprot:1148648-Pelagomonas_calceolata.AAC.11
MIGSQTWAFLQGRPWVCRQAAGCQIMLPATQNSMHVGCLRAKSSTDEGVEGGEKAMEEWCNGVSETLLLKKVEKGARGRQNMGLFKG